MGQEGAGPGRWRLGRGGRLEEILMGLGLLGAPFPNITRGVRSGIGREQGRAKREIVVQILRPAAPTTVTAVTARP